jgi:hypothetical protein
MHYTTNNVDNRNKAKAYSAAMLAYVSEDVALGQVGHLGKLIEEFLDDHGSDNIDVENMKKKLDGFMLNDDMINLMACCIYAIGVMDEDTNNLFVIFGKEY